MGSAVHLVALVLLTVLTLGAGILWQAAYLGLQGDKLSNAGDYPAAIKYYQKSIAVYPWYGQTFNKLGGAEEKIAEAQPNRDVLVLALNAYTEAHRLNPYQPRFLENLAYTSMALGRNDESAAYFMELIQKNPMVIRHYENLAYALITAGEKQQEEGPNYYAKVLEIPEMIDQARAKVSARGWQLKNTPQLYVSARLKWKLGQAEYYLGNMEEARISWIKAAADSEVRQEMERWAAENNIDLGI